MSVSHSMSGRLRLTWSSSCTGTLWPLRSCSISCDALLQLRALRFELLDFGEQRLQPRRFAVCAARSRCRRCADSLLQRPVPPADADDGSDENQAARHREPLAESNGRRLLAPAAARRRGG